MKNTLLSIFLVLITLTGFSKNWIVVNEGFVFAPDTVIIELGDTVTFELGDIHNAIEVSEATWNANGNTPLTGGFAVAFGGGMVLPDELPEGTHYYVCEPHAEGGMKGIIIVQSTIGIPDRDALPELVVFPNPSNGNFQVELSELPLKHIVTIEVLDLTGKSVYKTAVENTKFNLELSRLKVGVYFIRLYAGQTVLTRKIVIQ